MIRLEKKKWEFCIWENESFEYYFHFFQMVNSRINIIGKERHEIHTRPIRLAEVKVEK